VSAPRYDVPREEIDALAAEARKAGLAPAADMLVWLWQMLGSSRTYAAALVKVQPRKVREATEAAVHADCESLYEADFAEAARWLASEGGAGGPRGAGGAGRRRGAGRAVGTVCLHRSASALVRAGRRIGRL
jgi:hypothetical protein